MASQPLVLRGVSKRFDGAPADVLQDIDLSLDAGERLAIVGPSGSGKSTLLFVMGLLDRPSRGVVEVDGVDTAGMSDDALAQVRRDRIGFVFQDHHLLPGATALDNAVVPWMADGRDDGSARARATDLLTRLGLGDRLDHRPAALSTGQRQRVAVARALARAPGLVLADEPTGALDPERAHDLVDLLLEVADDAALVVVTHDPDVAARMDRVLRLQGGRLVRS